MRRANRLSLCLLWLSTPLWAQQYMGVGVRSGFGNFIPANYGSENLGYTLPNPASLTIGKVFASNVLTTWVFGRSEIAVKQGMALGLGARFYAPENFGKSSYVKVYAEGFVGVIPLRFSRTGPNAQDSRNVSFTSVGITYFASNLKGIDVFVSLIDSRSTIILRSNAYFGIGYNHFWALEKKDKPKRIKIKKIRDCPERYD